MSLAAIAPSAAAEHGLHASPRSAARCWSLPDDVEAALHAIPPLWPLPDYVAVNPFLGFVNDKFLDAHARLSEVRPTQLLMPRDYYRNLAEQGKLTKSDLHAALQRCRAEYPPLFDAADVDALWNWLAAAPSVETSPRFQTVAAALDRLQRSDWQSHIATDISRHCSSYFDQGQAIWKSPFREESLFAAWQAAAAVSWRMEMLGLGDFRQFAAELPAQPMEAIEALLEQLQVPPHAQRKFLQCELFSIAGWASYIKCRDAQQGDGQDLMGLLALRLAYDVALARATPFWPRLSLWPDAAEDQASPGPAVAFDDLARYAFQVAAEQAYRRDLLAGLGRSAASPAPPVRKTLQMVFCIDVRSEVFRRHLEAQHPAIETRGFAGFFGLPFEYLPPGHDAGRAQCPVLLQPGFVAAEASPDLTAAGRSQRDQAKDWKTVQTTVPATFSFVESLGIGYLFRLVAASLGWSGSAPPATGRLQLLAETTSPNSAEGPHELPLAAKVKLAEAMLRNLGLTKDFARVVILCGHAAEVTNNPYRAALDCGACGGHSGAPNARAGAALLNEGPVRAALRELGIAIPDDTWFVAALHVTTTDEIRLLEDLPAPAAHQDDLRAIRGWLAGAGEAARGERGRRLPHADSDSIAYRARDWSEVRPEWGLAGNAAFVVAPRARTKDLNLAGRTFLHSYDHRLDPEHKVLELIMTAPMVVTNWINLQYYASTVDNRSFGSGNKVIHDVVGRIGIYQGNGGDLMTGLPWQSLHDGQQLQHDPLRLLVVIESPRGAIDAVLRKHGQIKALLDNGWLSVVALEDECFYDYLPNVGWSAVQDSHGD